MLTFILIVVKLKSIATANLRLVVQHAFIHRLAMRDHVGLSLSNVRHFSFRPPITTQTHTYTHAPCVTLNDLEHTPKQE